MMGWSIPQADPDVLARARRGDTDAHAVLYQAFAPMVFTVACRILASRPAAEDVLQETFVDVIRKLASYRGEADVGFWIRRIAINKCLMHLRSGWVSRRVAQEPGEHAGPETLGRHAPDDAMDVEQALAALSDTARVVVWLHDVEGYTHREIGGLMGRSASFSKSQLARAHERLRELLTAERSAAKPCTPALKTC